MAAPSRTSWRGEPDGSLVTHKLLSENPEQLSRCRGRRHPPPAGPRRREPIPAEKIDAVKMGTTVATNALLERKGERTVLCHHARLPRPLRIAYQNRPRIFDRHIELPELLYRRVVEVDERVGARGRGGGAARRGARCAASSPRRTSEGFRSIAIVFMHGYRYPAARGARRGACAGGRLRAGLGFARGQPADEDRLARGHHGRRRVSLADPAPLRRSGRRRAAGRAPDVHAVERRPHRRASLPGQGLDPLRPRGRHRRHGAHVRSRGLRQGHRLRHGRHLHGRLALRGRARARIRDAGRRRAHARADDVDPHHRGRRRLDPASSTASASAWAPNRPAPIRGPRAIAAAGRSPSPTAT